MFQEDYFSNIGKPKGDEMSKEFKSYSMELAGRILRVDIGRVAAQANGAAFMHYGDMTSRLDDMGESLKFQ